MKNHDIEGATNAFRNAVSFSDNSVHEKAENFLNLGRCLSDLSKDNESEEGKQLAKEGIQVLSKAEEKFSDDDVSSVSAQLIQARIYQGQGSLEKAEDMLHKAECIIEESEIEATLGLELAKTFYAFNMEDRAQKLLINLSDKYTDEPDVLSRIEALMDEPEDLETRLRAKDLNRDAISKVDEGDLESAISFFRSALELTPRHAALNLNFVQVLVKHYKSERNESDLELAKAAINRLEHVPEQHHQYKRLIHFKKLLEKLEASEA